MNKQNWDRDFSLGFHGSKGFTLIEALIAAVLIAMFAASFTTLADAGIKQAKSSIELTKSVILCKNIMEEMRSRNYADLFQYNNAVFDNGSGSITVAPAGNDLVSITVKDKIELNTIRSKI